MIDRKNPAGQSGFSKPLVVTVIAICAVLAMGAAAALVPLPSTATREVSTGGAYAGPSGYFPDQFVNQAKQIEPMPEIYY
jgi:hypothetical protein